MPQLVRLLSIFPLVLLLAAFLQPQNASAQASATEMVELDPPAILELVPVFDGPLLRGEEMQFSLRISGAPKPINIWSVRVDYTTETLILHKVLPVGPEGDQAVAVSDPYKMRKGFESRSLAGMSISGRGDGEVARLVFKVKKTAPAQAHMALGNHPVVREKMAHDDKHKRKTYDYKRRLVFDKVKKLPVADVSAEWPPYEFPE